MNPSHSSSGDSISKEKDMRASFFAGFLDTAITGTAFFMANSSILMADFLKTFIEMTAIFLSWMALRRVNKGADNIFEYGVGKLENISSLTVGTVMIISVAIISGNAVINILHPGHIEGIGLWISIFGQSLYIIINGKESLKNRSLAKQHSSPIFQSQMRLFLTRFIGNVFILVSIILCISLKSFKWAVYIDPVSSLIVAASILAAAIGIFTSSFFDLLDRTLDEENQILILKELATHFHDYDELHGIRSRRAGSKVFIEIFLEFAPETTIAIVQDSIDKIRKSIESKISNSSVSIGLSRGSVK